MTINSHFSKMKIVAKKVFSRMGDPFAFVYNALTPKEKRAIFFFPHASCARDDYDMLNADSDNALRLFNNILHDADFNDYQLYLVCHKKNKMESYKQHCQSLNPDRVHFVFIDDKWNVIKSVSKCFTIFTSTDYTRIRYKTKKQRVICLNYFGGLIKNEFYRWEKKGGFKKFLQEQKRMFRLFDYHLSISDICSKFISLDNCHYYPHFLNLGFPRNDVFFEDHSQLREKIEALVDFPVKKIITYVPTHRDYENANRIFFEKANVGTRSIWGNVEEDELDEFKKTLTETNTLIIAKVHPIQKTQTSVLSDKKCDHIIFYDDLTQSVRTSLNPLLAISDCIITDYTTTVYDYLYVDRPIIYYFFDIEKYRETRGFFIEPIESVCAGHITYNLRDLQRAVRDIAVDNDIEREKRHFLRELFITYCDGNSAERIKKFFFNSETKIL